MSMEVDVDGPVALQARPQNAATILCCNCGIPIDGTTSAGALCPSCLALSVDASAGIQREGVLHFCKDCDRWLSPPAQWLVAQPESRELLALCLRRLRGLSKVRLVDANFVWTEPHSRRIRVRLTVQMEAPGSGGGGGGGVGGANGGDAGPTIVQQTFEVEFVVATQQCPDCAKSYTHNAWRAVVQARQHVPHKRTFLFLEQLILKAGAHRDAVNIKEAPDGIDFFFGARNHAEKFVDFLASVAPVRVTKSQELISMDVHTSAKSYKFSFAVEIVPLCKDDLVALPLKLARKIGNIYPITLCSRVGTAVQLLHPDTLQTADLQAHEFWHAPFAPLADTRQLVEFVVLDVEPVRLAPNAAQPNAAAVGAAKFLPALATVAKASDLGVNDTTYDVCTHLGALLKPGDSALGYHLANSNFNSDELAAVEAHRSLSAQLPDVVLVKKHYARKKKGGGRQRRNWKLRRMQVQEERAAAAAEQQQGGRAAGRGRGAAEDAVRMEQDFEMFLRDVEEDQELRNMLALYKAENKARKGGGERMEVEKAEPEEEEEESGSEGEEDGGLEIPMEQLLDEFEDMNMEDQ
ncbi:nonsense-mediated mRNA decay protein 3 [Lineolata rhizophorae]|uniref:60S ribosomal export protein NMD3 n=1 Tax=Lineolata rhizophorae TaxID=578093 RepID=A0A6A6P4G8_9PEZI|nr:nonsense-mediated mRNA decay protein 3 [Lineolata rhizophorae]